MTRPKPCARHVGRVQRLHQLLLKVLTNIGAKVRAPVTKNGHTSPVHLLVVFEVKLHESERIIPLKKSNVYCEGRNCIWSVSSAIFLQVIEVLVMKFTIMTSGYLGKIENCCAVFLADERAEVFNQNDLLFMYVGIYTCKIYTHDHAHEVCTSSKPRLLHLA